MFGFWRKNDGFKWVTYVPTRIRERRRQRREKLDAARIKIKSRGRYIADQAARGAKSALHGAFAWSARSATATWRKAKAIALTFARSVGARCTGLLQTLRPLSIAAWKRASQPHMATALGVVGLALIGAAAFVGFKTGFDVLTSLVGITGMTLAIVFLGRRLFEIYAPPAARSLLRLLRRDRGQGAVKGWQKLASPTVLALAGIATAALAIGWVVLDRRSAMTPVEGHARAITGEVLRVGDTDYRLAGIAAPEPEQRCGEGSRRWNCASDATRSLAALVRGRPIVCHPRPASPPARATARCYAGQTDVAAELVRLGHVWADESDSLGYRSLEAKAREAKAGVWRAPSDPPWVWRGKLWASAKSKSPEGCPIKGTTSGGEKVYVMPWSPEYDRIRVTAGSKSRRWFCTEAEAIAAGYRALQGS
jgi:endonuclease YncB( thermonuclease family)